MNKTKLYYLNVMPFLLVIFVFFGVYTTLASIVRTI